MLSQSHLNGQKHKSKSLLDRHCTSVVHLQRQQQLGGAASAAAVVHQRPLEPQVETRPLLSGKLPLGLVLSAGE